MKRKIARFECKTVLMKCKTTANPLKYAYFYHPHGMVVLEDEVNGNSVYHDSIPEKFL